METINVRRLHKGYAFKRDIDGYVVAGWLLLYANAPEGREFVELLNDLRQLWTKSETRVAEICKVTRKVQIRLKRLFGPPIFLGFDSRDENNPMISCRFYRPAFPHAQLIAESFENLGRLGLLDRIRQCRCCGLWLFAKFKRQWYCSGTCREKAFRSSKEGRKKRAEYMSKYREKLKRLDEALIRTARRPL